MKASKLALALVLTASVLSAETRPFNDFAYSAALRIQNRRTWEITTNDLPEGRADDVLYVLRRENSIPELLRLKDQVTIDKRMAQFIAARGQGRMLRRWLKESCSPWMLERLAPLLYEEDVPHRRPGEDDDLGDMGYSMTVAAIMANIVATSREFPEEVRKAAAGIPGLASNYNSELITVMRRWWETNGAHVRAEQYDKVTSPIYTPAQYDWPAVAPAVVRPKPEPPPPSAPSTNPPAARPVVPPAPPPPSNTQASAACSLTPVPPPPARRRWPVAALTALVLLGAGFALTRPRWR